MLLHQSARTNRKIIWGYFGAVALTLLAAGVIGGVEHALHHGNHLLGNWSVLIGAGTGSVGYLIGRAAA
jgi:hypothetical protein